MYYCSECQRQHRSGKIYQEHLIFKAKKEIYIPSDKILEFSYSEFKNGRRALARRQISNHFRQIKLNPRWCDMYIQQINRVIMYERGELKDG